MRDKRVAAAHVRARFTADWLACWVGNAPTQVREFVYQDVPYLFGLVDGYTDDEGEPTGADRLVETIRMAQRLAELVRLARLADDATTTSDDPTLWRARESDLQEGLRGLRKHRMRLLVEQAVRELSATDWRDGPIAGEGPDDTVELEWREPT